MGPYMGFFLQCPSFGTVLSEPEPKAWLKSVGVFSPTSCTAGIRGGGGVRTVVGEKSPTSPAFCNSWDAMFMRVKVNRVVNLLPGFLSQLLIFCKKKKTKRYALFLFVRSVTLL